MTGGSPRLVLLFACFAHAWFHVLTGLFLTLALVLERVWERPYEEIIGLWTFGALLVGLGAPIAGWLSDRFGETRVIVTYFIGVGTATTVCGLSQGPSILALGLGLMGLFGAIYHPVGTAWVMKNAIARGKAIGILEFSGGIGAAAASFVAGTLTTLISWRAAFAIPGVLSILAGLYLLFLFITNRVVDRDTDLSPQQEPKRADVRQAFIVLSMTMSLTTIVYYAFTTMIPKWLEQAVGDDLGDSLFGIGALVTIVYLVGASAKLIAGPLCDRGWTKRLYVVSYALKFGALVLAVAVTSWSVVIMAATIVFLFELATPVESILIARFTPTARRGLAYGIRNGIAIVAGPVGVQLVAHLFDEKTGFDNLLLVLGAIVLAILLTALFLPADRAQNSRLTSAR